MRKGEDMKLSIVLGFSLFLLVQNAHSGLKELIEQNVKDASKSYDQVLIETEQQKNAARLWIHVRNEDQNKAVKEILEWLKSIKLGGKTIELRPIRLVEYGPNESDLRFFKKQDAEYAKHLLTKLKKILPKLELKDLSRQYKNIVWIKPGHYELWLSPDIKILKVPQ